MAREKISLISLVGMEGSGKTTVAKSLVESLSYTYVCTGDMLREARNGPIGELQEACEKLFTEHVYLPGPMLLEVVKQRFQKDDINNGLILDGGFRTLEETEGFKKMLSSTGKDFKLNIFYLRVPRWKCMERLMGENGRKRSDDTLEGILKRAKEFDNNLGKRMSLIRTNFSLEIVDGDRPREEVFQSILTRVNR
ncbi:MAG: nucleoside monophosphate kinase [Candidatus Shapirobacteria bacterium]|jgi:adenylate kinase family enzyme